MNARHVGDVSIQRIVELETVGSTRFLFPQATRDAVIPIDWLRPHFADNEGNLVMCIHSYLLKTAEQTILIDTALGNDKERPIPPWHQRSGRYLEDLAALGVSRESVDLVICTHLHVDHVGWNTMLVDGQWVPTFPNARYLFGRVEWEHWSQRDDHGFGTVIEDSVRPIVDAGLADLFEMDGQLTKEIRAEPTPGHSIGHTSLWVESAGERALITGDFFHHPCQAARIEWCSTADYDREQAIDTRRRMFKQLAKAKVPVFGMHFDTPGIVVPDGDAYRIVAKD
jgi:glyoxylase-like metal-dependent hydrolase (beta-lactamase superfamily II)